MVKNISKTFLLEIMDKILADWEVNDNKKIELVNFLYNSFIRVDEILQVL